MEFYSFSLYLLTVLSGGVIPVCESGNFPLKNCSTDEMDVLFLYFDAGGERQSVSQKNMSFSFIQHLISFSFNKATPRVLFAGVYDRFSAHNPLINVSSWQFQESPEPPVYGIEDFSVKRSQCLNFQEIIDLKIAFIKRLFSEMGGVRHNVDHIAVVFIDGDHLSFTDVKNVSQYVKQQKTHIKIYVVVFGDEKQKQMVHMDDALLVEHYRYSYSNRLHILTMAICKQCVEDWFLLEHINGSEAFSCYKLLPSNMAINILNAQNMCLEKGGFLVAIQTHEELEFLREKLYLSFEKNEIIMGDMNNIFQVFVGLHRDTASPAKRFQWALEFPTQNHPLVINNWMPGEPSHGHSRECGMWKFVRSYQTKLETNFSSSGYVFYDGWVDIACDNQTTAMSLCEVTLARRIEDTTVLKITPATDGSFKKALNKGDFTTFKDNIVSVSANTANADFLKQIDQEFPVFDCGENNDGLRYVSYVAVCDSKVDCLNRRDEIGCVLEQMETHLSRESTNNRLNCNGVYCCDGSCLPLQFVNDGEVDCDVCEYKTGETFHDEFEGLNKHLRMNRSCAFICNFDQCVDFSQLNDNKKDCNEIDGRLDETIGKLSTVDSCDSAMGHRIWAPKCIFIRDRYGAVYGCRDMSHLQNCSDFDCPEQYFKCPNSYCIPQHYVLGGKVDCPTGEEERKDIVSSCIRNFACWDSKMCLHPDLVCNGHPDCPHKDDEVDCNLNLTCPDGFRCTSGTVTVSNYNRSDYLQIFNISNSRTKYLDMSGINLSRLKVVCDPAKPRLVVVKWSSCNISNLDMLRECFYTLQHLDISYNLMQTLDGRDIDYYSLGNIRILNMSNNRELTVVQYLDYTILEVLDLSFTKLNSLDVEFSKGLPNLKHLNLSYTAINFFNQNTFMSKTSLWTLDLRGLTVTKLMKNVFENLTIIQNLFTDRFELCCPQIRGPNIPSHTCKALGDAISSCYDLLRVNVQRFFLWVVAVLALLGNITVIGYRVIWDSSVIRTGYGLFVTNLGISDFIMGVYLFIIAGADIYYRDIYVLYDKIWRESVVCRFAGFLATLSCETSTFFIFLITLDRFLAMKFPFGQMQLHKWNKIMAVILSWIMGIGIALIPTVLNFKICSANAMCIGLPLTYKRPNGWGFSFGVFFVLNCFLFFLIAFGQRAIFQAMSENRINGTQSKTSPRRVEDITVVKQLSLIALSNFLCWFPVGLTALLSLGDYEVSNDVYSWITVIVLPINSAANPLLYTIPAIMTKWERFKYGLARLHHRHHN